MPCIAAIIALVQVAVATASEHDVRRIGPCMHRPHGRIGRGGHGQALPRFAHIFGAHYRTDASRGGIADGQKDGLRLLRRYKDAARIGPRKDVADIERGPRGAVVRAGVDLVI